MKRRVPFPVSSQAGFTLLELLLATAIAAVVLAVVQTTYFGALRLQTSTHQRIDEQRVVERTLAQVRRDCAGLVMPGGLLGGQLQTDSLTSLSSVSGGERVTPDLVTTSGIVDGWSPFSEVQRVAYYLAPSADGGRSKDLVRVVTRNLLPAAEAWPEEQVVLPGVASATIEFYDGYGWTDSWDSEASQALPRGLRFTLVRSDAQGNASGGAIELVVPVLVTTNAQARAQAAEETL